MVRKFEDITKQCDKSSTTLERALEAVKTELQKYPGIIAGELEKRICAAVPCSLTTANTAIKMDRADGSITAERDGRCARYYLEVAPMKKSDKILPVRRQVIKASEAPRVCGARLNPIEWTLATLMEMTC